MNETAATVAIDPTVVPLPDVELVETDGEPLDSTWHRDEINLLVEQVRYHRRERHDYFVGGNMFIYFDEERARNRNFRGPDFFFVEGVRWEPLRPYWVIWQEGGKYPNVIIELLSPTTAEEDRTTKKTVYEQSFRTPEYFLYDPDTETLEGYRLNNAHYVPIEPNERGWLWCAQLQLWLGKWEGEYQGCRAVWLRFYDRDGNVVPLFAESEAGRAEAEKQRAEAEKQRADDEKRQAEAERQRAEAEKQRAEAEKKQAESERQRAEAAEAELARLREQIAQRDAGAEGSG